MFRKEQEPWEYPRELLVPGRILSLSRPSATAAWGSASPSTGIQVQNADSDSGGLSWGLRVLHSGGCWPAHHTWTSKALGDQSQPSLRTPAALTPASLIISFKLTHSWKKEKQTIKTLILPHLWVSFFQHIMSHCDNYATSSCSTYLQPKKQRPSINTCYIISTHWLLSHSLLKICLFTCLSFPFDYQSRENSLFLVGPHEGWPERSTPCCLLTQPRDFTLKHTTLRFLGRTLNKNIASFLRI